jgi:non-specific serine/threonine protein kinase
MRQLRRLMAPLPAAAPGEPDQPGMSEQAAAFAVLGCDVEGMAIAVARWMGLGGSDESVLKLMRRLPLDKAVRATDNDDDLLRALGSAANEAVDALALPPERQAAAVERVAKRYARVLELTPRDLMAALQASAVRASAEPAAAAAT